MSRTKVQIPYEYIHWKNILFGNLRHWSFTFSSIWTCKLTVEFYNSDFETLSALAYSLLRRSKIKFQILYIYNLRQHKHS